MTRTDYNDPLTRKALTYKRRLREIADHYDIPNIDHARLQRVSWRLAKTEGGFDDMTLRTVVSLAARGVFD